MKKILGKQILIVGVLALIVLMLNTISVEAALQANQNTEYKTEKSETDWIKAFREMEKTGGAMGLDETFNDTTLVADKSNDIDVHMMKATEYGAIAILSASGYGNPDNARDITTTTGNNTGVMLQTGNWEYVAGGLSGSIFKNVNSRYFDSYGSDKSSVKRGDALGDKDATNPGCEKWHGASTPSWVYASWPYFARGYYGIFSFNRDIGTDCARGVAVCGQGL